VEVGSGGGGQELAIRRQEDIWIAFFGAWLELELSGVLNGLGWELLALLVILRPTYGVDFCFVSQ